MKLKSLPFFLVVFFLISCKKSTYESITKISVSEIPSVRFDNYFTNGILQFKSTEDLKYFWYQSSKDIYYANKMFHDFKTLQNSFDDFRKSQTSKSKAVSELELNQVSSQEFLYDEYSTVIPDPSLAGVLNTELQVIVNDTLYQLTRIGIFKTQIDNIENYNSLLTLNQNSIIYDANFNSLPGEVPIGNGEYLVAPGIIREDGLVDLFKQTENINGTIGNSDVNPTNGTGIVQDNYLTVTIPNDNKFNKGVAVVFNDFAKRRLVLDADQDDISLFGFGYHSIGITGKIQREKRFLWFTYWGESFADELHIGCDNMNLVSDYIFPTPQYFNTMSRPEVENFADFEIGNHILQVMNIKVNFSALGYTLDNNQLNSFLNNQFNSFAGNVYTDLFKGIENKVLNSIDASYVSRYSNYTKKLNSIKDDNRLKWVIGKTEKNGYNASKNTWRMDWNIGFSYTQNGGVGGYPLQYSYAYDMKGGSFYARARTGNTWHGVRIVKL